MTILNININLSREFSTKGFELISENFSTPGSGTFFSDEGYSSFEKVYTLDTDTFSSGSLENEITKHLTQAQIKSSDVKSIAVDGQKIQSLIRELKPKLDLANPFTEEEETLLEQLGDLENGQYPDAPINSRIQEKLNEYFPGRDLKTIISNNQKLQSAYNAYVYKKDEGPDLLREYQTFLSANKDISFNDYLTNQLKNNWTQFKQKYPTIAASVPTNQNGTPALADETVIVANLSHNPVEVEINNQKYVLTQQTKSSFLSYEFDFLEPEEHRDYHIGNIEKRGKLFAGGNFTGCNFKNIEFMHSDLKNTSFRDCKFEKVGFINTALSGSDLRGAKLARLVFDAYSQEDAELANIKFDLTDVSLVQDLGILQLYARNKEIDSQEFNDKFPVNYDDYKYADKEEKKQLFQQIAENKKKHLITAHYSENVKINQIKELYDALPKSKMSQAGSFFTGIASYVVPQGVQDVASSVSSGVKSTVAGWSSTPDKLEVEIQKVIDGYPDAKQTITIKKLFTELKAERTRIETDIEREVFVKRREIQEYIQQNSRLDLDSPELDPTYTRGQNIAGTKKLVPCTRTDLEAYAEIAKTEKITFADYIKNTKGLTADLTAVPDLRGADLQNLDLHDLNLSGIIMAKANLSGTNLSGAELVGTSLEGATINNTDFSKAHLTDSNMIGVSGESVNFQKAEGARLRLSAARIGHSDRSKSADFTGAKLYALDAIKGDLDNCLLVGAEMDYADFSQANMLYVDARQAELRGANLSETLISGSDFTKANLEGAILEKITAHKTNFTAATLDSVKAFQADFKQSIFDEVKARGADWTEANFSNLVSAKRAEFKNSIMDGINAEGANLESAILTDVKAQGARFKEAILRGVQAERIDIRDAVLTRANLHGANLEEANMQRVRAEKANFTEALMNKVNAELATFTSACFKDAKLQEAIINKANCNNVNFSGADLTGVYEKMDKENPPILINANFTDTIGAGELIKIKVEQEKAQSLLFSRSRYGHCANPEQRLASQKLGMEVLTGLTTAGLGPGFLSSMLGFEKTALLGGAFTKYLLDQYVNQDTFEAGYIDNVLGDRFAELGTMTAVFAAETAEVATDQVFNISTAALGRSNIAMAQHFCNAAKNKFNKEAVLTEAWQGMGKNYAIKQLPYSMQAALMCANDEKAQKRIYSAAEDMWNFENNPDGTTKKGKKPEEIYTPAIQKLVKQVNKWLPTVQKVVVATVCATVAGVALFALFHFALPAVGIGFAAKLATAAAVSAFCGGGMAGYKYDEEIVDTLSHPSKLLGKTAHNESSGINARKQEQQIEAAKQAQITLVDKKEPQHITAKTIVEAEKLHTNPNKTILNTINSERIKSNSFAKKLQEKRVYNRGQGRSAGAA